MRGLLLVACVIVALVAAVWRAPPVGACSFPDFDPVAESELIVAGRITDWDYVQHVTKYDPKNGAPEPLDDPDYYGPSDTMAPIRIQMAVERVYKGSVASEAIELIDPASLSILPEDEGKRYLWGYSNACPAFNADPSGKYVILGLSMDQFGRYHPSLPRVFYVGDEPPADFTDQRLSGLAALLPASGGLPPTEVQNGAPLTMLGAILSLVGAVLAGSAYAWRRSET